MSTRSARATRLLLGAAIPVVVVTAAFVPLMIWNDRLPSRLATHWGLSGPPNGSMTKHGFAIFVAAFVVPCVVALVVLAARTRFSRGVRAMTAAIVGSVAGIIAGAALVTFAVNRDVADWRTASSPNWAVIAAIVAGGLLVGGVSARTAAAIDQTLPPDDSDISFLPAPTLGLTTGERAVWTASAHAHWVIALDVALLALGIVLMVAGQIAVGIIMAASAFLTSPLASIDVRADRRGLRIAYGPLHWPVQRFAIDRIERADAIDVKPMQWGGWGYRGSIRLFKRAAVVLRGGEGLRLTLPHGEEFAVTVDDAATGAAVLNDAITASGRATPR